MRQAHSRLCVLLLCLTAIAAVVTAVPASAAPVVWAAPSYTRVMPDTAAGTATEISVYAAQAEWESAQVIVRGPATGVRVTVPSSALTVRLYEEHYHTVTRGSGTYATQVNKPDGPGIYPDALLPMPSSFNVATGQNQPVWIDVFAPRGTTPGLYTIPVTVTSNEGTTVVTVRFTVWSFALPVKPALKSSFLHRKVRNNAAADQLMLENRLMPISVATTEERRFIDSFGLNSRNLGFWANAVKTAGTANAAPTTSAVLAEKAKHQQDLWFYAYTFDEISPYLGASEPTLRDNVIAYGRALHGAGADQLVTTPPNTALFDDGLGTGRSVVDVWVELPKQYDVSLVNQAIAKGDEVWSYNCLAQDGYSPKWQMNYPFPNWRLQPGMINWQLGMTGLLYWSTDYWSTTQWDSVEAYGLSYPAEGLLFYNAPTGFAPSIRLKWLRDGVDDFDYLKILDALGQRTWAKSAVGAVATDWRTWSHDPAAIEAVRRQLGERISSLSSPHTVSATAAVSPATVASGGSASLTATATDSSGHGIASWSWSDSGAGGSFSPSATVQNPTYVAAANATGANRTVTLTVTARCNGSTSAASAASATLTVQSLAHTLSATAGASPATTASAGSTALSASATDSLGHGIASWSWSDSGAGGSFAPSAGVQNPTYSASANTTDLVRQVTLRVTATCAGSPAASASASTIVSVNPVAHTLSVSASALPATIASGGSTSLSASALDSRGDAIIGWQWSDSGAGGSFAPSPNVSNPTYTAAANTTGTNRVVTLAVTATCNGSTPIGSSASTTVTVQSAAHQLTVNASASPATVASGDAASLSASATDTLGHVVATWSWSDGGAGGSFSPSAAAQNPSYTAAANTTGANRVVTLTVTATCDGSTPFADSASTTLTVQSVPHMLSVGAVASASTVASGGAVSLTAAASDTLGHVLVTWSWSDGGTGGSFSPSATVQNPTYTAAANTTGADRAVTLIVTAGCDGPTPISDSGAVTVTVQPAGTTLSVDASTPIPAVVASESTATLAATTYDSARDQDASWFWDDGGANGAFLPSAAVRNPQYRAPHNATGRDMHIALTVTAACSDPVLATGVDSTAITVESVPHTLTVTGTAVPSVVAWKARTQLYATADDSLGDGIAEWVWSDNGAGGSFTPSNRTQNPTYRVPNNTSRSTATIILSVSAACNGASPLTATNYLTLTVQPKSVLRSPRLARLAGHGIDGLTGTRPVTIIADRVASTPFSDLPADFWAADAIEACRRAGILTGFPDGTYRPDLPVNREQVAVYVARAVAGGDVLVPDGPAEASFADVPTGHWAYRYVEYAKATGIVAGFPDGRYYPASSVNRAEMAAFVARSVVIPTGDGGLESYQPPDQPTFSDVPTSHWAYRYVEYLVEHGIASGYSDGTFQAAKACTRAEMAVYLARGFRLGT